MTVYTSMTELISYFDEQETIPASISVYINGVIHEFTRTSHHTDENITKSMSDNYSFVEKENFGLGIELHINYYRHFEEKRIVEAYMALFLDDGVLFLHPIYFYDNFVTDSDFDLHTTAISDSLQKWTNLRWVNINEVPEAFADFRANAYRNIQTDLFYLVPNLINASTDEGLSKDVLDALAEERKKKWLIDDYGESCYFSTPFEVPECW